MARSCRPSLTNWSDQLMTWRRQPTRLSSQASSSGSSFDSSRKKCCGLAQLGRGAADPAARVDEVDGVERPAAVLALVAAGPWVAAVRAGALDVAVGQEPLRLRVVHLLAGLDVDVAALAQPGEDVLGHPAVVVGHRRGEQVERDAELVPLAEELGVEALDDLDRLDALLVGPHRDGRAVGVAARHHQHVVAPAPVVAGEDVGRQVGAGDVAEVLRAVRVRPGHGHEDRAWRLRPSPEVTREGAPLRPGVSAAPSCAR